jgi:putative phosphoribosyl transferase
MALAFSDRTQAGRLLAKALWRRRSHSDLLILALARGGIPDAFEHAEALQAPLDLLTVPKEARQ